MTQTTQAATPDPATDPRIDPQVRAFLKEINKDSESFLGASSAEATGHPDWLAEQDPGRHVGGVHDRADHHPGWSNRENLHHEARADLR